MKLIDKLKIVQAENSALLATNFYNFETLRGIVQAAKSLDKPIILQLTRSSIEYMGLVQAVKMARTESAESGIEGWIHLDHGDSVGLAERCIDAGFDSVMIDASENPIEKNIEITQRVVEIAHKHGVMVEAELGYVAKLGQHKHRTGFTDPQEARLFVEATKVDILAVAIGTTHGFYTESPDLDLERLLGISSVIPNPLVLHGGSGIPHEMLKEAVRRGICKVNLATEIKHAFMSRIKTDISESEEIDLRKVFPPAIKEVEKLVSEKLLIVSK